MAGAVSIHEPADNALQRRLVGTTCSLIAPEFGSKPATAETALPRSGAKSMCREEARTAATGAAAVRSISVPDPI